MKSQIDQNLEALEKKIEALMADEDADQEEIHWLQVDWALAMEQKAGRCK